MKRTVDNILAVPFDADVHEADLDGHIDNFEEIIVRALERILDHGIGTCKRRRFEPKCSDDGRCRRTFDADFQIALHLLGVDGERCCFLVECMMNAVTVRRDNTSIVDHHFNWRT